MSILVLGEVHVAPSRIAEFKDYFRDLLPDSRAYDGFEKVELYEDTEEEGSILFVEYWASRAHQERYIAWRIETGVMERLGAMFVGDTRVRYFRNTGL